MHVALRLIPIMEKRWKKGGWADGVAQLVACPPTKCKALNSNHQKGKNERTKERERKNS
jgi:hypothetical protein